MSECAIAILAPIWVGIIFNLLMTVFNIVGMAANLHGRAIDWYLGRGGILIMCFVWSFLLGFSIIGGIGACS